MDIINFIKNYIVFLGGLLKEKYKIGGIYFGWYDCKK